VKPSVIQQNAIVPISQGHDIVGQAQSGTGKTGTFTIGLLQRVSPEIPELQAIVLVPTRELARQARDVIQSVGHYTGVKVKSCIGGQREFIINLHSHH